MEYLKAKDFSQIWDISERRIIKLCQENRIKGAIKNGKIWEIPANTLKPSDKRSNIYKYINVEKRIMIIDAYPEIKEPLKEQLLKEGFTLEFKEINEIKNNLQKISQYYENLIYFTKNHPSTEKDFIMKFAERLNYESSIVLVETIKNKSNIEKDLAALLNKKIGVNINTLLLDIEPSDLVNYNEISTNIIELLLRFKNTSGCSIVTDGAKLSFDKNNRTDYLLKGPFYKAINTCFKDLHSSSHIWCASTMLDDEWTEEPEEMKFRLLNLELANRGINFERIFIIKKSKLKDYQNNKTLKIYMQSNIKTIYVDYDEIIEKAPHLLETVESGWDGIDDNTLIVDLELNNYRGYISKNKEEIEEAYKCFQELKKYGHELKEILK